MSDAVASTGAPMEAEAGADRRARRAEGRVGPRRLRRRTRAGKQPGTGRARAKRPARPREPLRLRAQLAAIARCSHPRQAVLMALAVGILARMTDRSLLSSFLAAAGVLVVQLALGLGNDVADEQRDRAAGTDGKPLAADAVPRGNVTYAVLVLVLLSVPLAFENGTLGGAVLLITLLIGGIHNKWLHRGMLSWVGWVATFGLLPAYISYGALPGDPHGPAPTWAFTAAAALLGLCLHFATSLPDLVQDHAARLRTLPLRIALKTGAPRLLQVTVVLTALVLVGLLVAGLTVGIRQ